MATNSDSTPPVPSCHTQIRYFICAVVGSGFTNVLQMYAMQRFNAPHSSRHLRSICAATSCPSNTFNHQPSLLHVVVGIRTCHCSELKMHMYNIHVGCFMYSLRAKIDQAYTLSLTSYPPTVSVGSAEIMTATTKRENTNPHAVKTALPPRCSSLVHVPVSHEPGLKLLYVLGCNSSTCRSPDRRLGNKGL